jgi:hypothetical protein
MEIRSIGKVLEGGVRHVSGRTCRLFEIVNAAADHVSFCTP